MTTVSIRAFAAARAHLGWSQRTHAVDDGATVATVLQQLGEAAPEAAPVLARCAVLVDGRRVPAPGEVVVREGANIDLLPPFAGG